MRTLTANTSTKANTQQGTEPLIILRVEWGGSVGTKHYSERALSLGSVTALPRILDIGALSSRMRQSNVGSYTAISFKLDDTLGDFKSVYDSINVERTPATIYQHFEGLAEADLSILFKGAVTGPIEWDEGERTFSFVVESAYLQDQVGHAPNFASAFGTSALAGGDGVDENAVGKMWPLVFGTVVKLPAVRISKAPEADIVRQDGNIWILDNASRCPVGGGNVLVDGVYFAGSFVSNTFVVSNPNSQPTGWQGVGTGSRDVTDADVNNPAVIWLANYVSMVGACAHFEFPNYTRIDPDGVSSSQPYKAVYRIVRQVGKKITLDRPVYFASGAENIIGAGESFDVAKEPLIGWPSPFDSQGSRNFRVIREGGIVIGYSYNYGSGTKLVVSGYSDVHVCAENSADIYAVYANKRGRLELVPSQYYSIGTASLFGHSALTAIAFPVPLNMFADQGWSGDQIYVTLKSTVTTASAVISYLLSNYTTLNYLGGSVTPTASCNFAVTSVQNALKLCEDIAYQVGLGLKISGTDVSLVDVAYESASVMTIAEAKVEAFTLKMRLTDTPDIYTRQLATWKEDLSKPEQRLILSQNTSRYGTIESSIEFSALSQYGDVYPAAYFWLNRKANIWKIVSFRMDTPGILLEVFDIVTVAFADTTLIGVASRTGVVISTDYDVKTKSVEVSVMLPFKAGSTTRDTYFWLDGISFPGGTAPSYVHIYGLEAVTVEEARTEDIVDAEKASNSAVPAVITQTLGANYLADMYHDGYYDSLGNPVEPTMISVPVNLQGPWEPAVGDQVTATMSNKKAFVETNNPTVQTTMFGYILGESPAGTYSVREWDPVANVAVSPTNDVAAKELNGSVDIAVGTIVILHAAGSSWRFFFPVATCS